MLNKVYSLVSSAFQYTNQFNLNLMKSLHKMTNKSYVLLNHYKTIKLYEIKTN